jgi:hypothetical protein
MQCHAPDAAPEDLTRHHPPRVAPGARDRAQLVLIACASGLVRAGVP